MKTAIVCIAAVVLGTVLGIVLARGEFAGDIDEVAALATEEGQAAPLQGPGQSHPSGGYPRVKVQGDAEHDFGVMEKDETLRHTFVLENVGDSPLELHKENTTCKCTLSELDDNLLEPGDSAEVTLEWTPDNFQPLFRQKALIRTNDPANQIVELSIVGRVIQTVRPIPEEVLFKNVALTEQRTATLHVYCYRAGGFDLKLAGLKETDTAEYFDVQINPLSNEEVAAEQDAKAGVAVVVTLKPGIPLGPIEQTLQLTTQQDDLPDIDIPIRGSVTGDINIVARATLYDSDRKLLKLGTVNRHQGKDFPMRLLVKGPHYKDVEFTVGQVDPADVLTITIDTDNPVDLEGKNVRMYPMTVRIPPGSPAVSRLGGAAVTDGAKLGRIVIETTHPLTKEIRIRVQVATEG